MTVRRHLAAFGVAGLALLVLLLAATTIYFGRDEYQQIARDNGEEIDARPVADEKLEPGRLRIPPAEMAASGLVLAPLEKAEATSGIEVYGSVVDLKPLLDAREQYALRSGEIRTLRATVRTLEAEYRRVSALYQDDRNVSERVMQQARADWQAAQARLDAASTALGAMVETARVTWGEKLADMALNGSSPAFRGLVDGREVLALLAVPYAHADRITVFHVTVTPTGGGRRVDAKFVAPASTAMSGIPGVTFFYRMAAAGVRVGTRLTAYLAEGDGEQAGVVVPERAVVWYAGRPWIYLQDEKDADVFERTPVTADRLVPGGWFNATGLEAGRKVVVTGAQLLLSEELEYQIRNENED
ncbi:MAG: hypothetical protein GC151_09180 [Betaproteobacteria bacterium]|nr:hypothetical protein [Betaproteobacteria bacterium]